MNDAARRAPAGDGVARWFAGAQQGDPEAVDGLFAGGVPDGTAFAARRRASREDAEDAVQDALTALVRRAGALRAAGAVTNWLFVTIRRACLRRVPGVVLVPTGGAGDLAAPSAALPAKDKHMPSTGTAIRSSPPKKAELAGLPGSARSGSRRQLAGFAHDASVARSHRRIRLCQSQWARWRVVLMR